MLFFEDKEDIYTTSANISYIRQIFTIQIDKSKIIKNSQDPTYLKIGAMTTKNNRNTTCIDWNNTKKKYRDQKVKLHNNQIKVLTTQLWIYMIIKTLCQKI